MMFVISTTFIGVRGQIFSGSRSPYKTPIQLISFKLFSIFTCVSGTGLVLASHHEVLLPAGPGNGHQDAKGVQFPHLLLVAALLLPDPPDRRGSANVLEYVEVLVSGDAITLWLH